MRVLKFGGTSVANADRILNIAGIAEKKLTQGQLAMVLSAPAKITNYLVAMVEQTVSGQEANTLVHDAAAILGAILDGLRDAVPGFEYDRLKH